MQSYFDFSFGGYRPASLLTAGSDQVWFLGENANYAAGEYAWESATSPSTALMMLDGDKMVAAASSRNPTLAGAIIRLQRCAISGSWEVDIVELCSQR
jgi:hypothetical protein